MASANWLVPSSKTFQYICEKLIKAKPKIDKYFIFFALFANFGAKIIVLRERPLPNKNVLLS